MFTSSACLNVDADEWKLILMPKEIIHGQDARRLAMNGIDKLAEAVKSTLGPKGRNVALGRRYAAPTITHDGVTVARHVELEDVFEDMGAQVFKEVANQTNIVAGDGTTTSVVMAQAILKQGLRNIAAGANPMLIRLGVQRAIADAIKLVAAQAVPVKSLDEIKSVATISAAEQAIGDLVGEAIDKVGPTGAVSVEESTGLNLEIEYVDGIRLDSGFLSPYFVTSEERMQAELDDCFLLISDAQISSVADILPVLEVVKASGGNSLLVMGDAIADEAMATLVMNKMQGNIGCVAIDSPEWGDARDEVLEDIAALTGGAVISDRVGRDLASVTIEDLGRCRRVVVDRESSTLVGGHGSEEQVAFRVNQVASQIKETPLKHDQERLESRLGKLSGGVAILRVGGATETEVREKAFRVEDAVAATRAAVEEGIVPGGGVTLLAAAEGLDSESLRGDENTGYRSVIAALEEPIKQIARNAGFNGDVVVGDVKRRQIEESNKAIGFDVISEQYVDMMDEDVAIIDPAKVVRCVLENAGSIAGMVLTIGALVAEVPENDHEFH